MEHPESRERAGESNLIEIMYDYSPELFPIDQDSNYSVNDNINLVHKK